MEKLDQMSRPNRHDRIPAHKMPDYLPSAAHQVVGHHLDSEVQVQIFRHRSTNQNLTIPAVAEPLLVLVVSGAALVEAGIRRRHEYFSFQSYVPEGNRAISVTVFHPYSDGNGTSAPSGV